MELHLPVSPPATKILQEVINHIKSYKGRVLLIAPFWEAQPWFPTLKVWCPNPLLLGSACLCDNEAAPLLTSLRLNAWSFSRRDSPATSHQRW